METETTRTTTHNGPHKKAQQSTIKRADVEKLRRKPKPGSYYLKSIADQVYATELKEKDGSSTTKENKMGELLDKAKGKIKKTVGVVTGDRELEAEYRRTFTTENRRFLLFSPDNGEE